MRSGCVVGLARPFEAKPPKCEALDRANERELVALAIGTDGVHQHGVPTHQERAKNVEADLVANHHDLGRAEWRLATCNQIVLNLAEVTSKGCAPRLAGPLAERPGWPEHLLRLTQDDVALAEDLLQLSDHWLEVAIEAT